MMITEENIRQAISKALKRFDVDQLQSNQNFSDAGLDSLDHASIILALDEHCGIEIPESDIESCDSIDAILAYARVAEPS